MGKPRGGGGGGRGGRGGNIEGQQRSNEPDLHGAARAGDLQKVESICNSNPLAVNTRDRHSRTPYPVLPDGTTWIPNLVKVIVEVVSNGSEPIVVDQKLIDGPNPNNWGKRFIPLIVAFQYLFVIKSIKGSIQKDMESERIPAWELRDRGLAKGKF